MTHPWNFRSGVGHCKVCEGTGSVPNGRGLGGNDPDSFNVDCPACDGDPIIPCEVCGCEVTSGFDCIACDAVAELPSSALTEFDAIAKAIKAAMEARLLSFSAAPNRIPNARWLATAGVR